MTSKGADALRRICAIVLSISIILAGFCLCVQCIRIYKRGEQPFSRETVAAALSEIRLPLLLCAVLTAAGFAADAFLPESQKRATASKNNAMILNRLRRSTDLSQCSEALRQEIGEQAHIRRRRQRITWSLLAAGSLVFLVYAAAFDPFHKSEINRSMICAMTVLLPCLLPAFCHACIAEKKNRLNIQQEIQLYKQAPAEAKCKQSAASDPDKRSGKLRLVFIVTALVLLLYGYLSGGTADVLTKAINICTECVGLG